MKLLVINISGSFIKYAYMTEDMEILSGGKIKILIEGLTEIIEIIGRLYDELPSCNGIAVSVTEAADLNLKEHLHKRCPVKICIESHAKCIAVAEAAKGSLKDVANGLVMIFNDRNEYELIQIQKSLGTFSTCEVFYSVGGKNVEKEQSSNQSDRCLKEFAERIAAQLFDLQNVLQPRRFVISGKISMQPLFIEYIRECLKGMYTKFSYGILQAEVVSCKFQDDADLVGAFYCFLSEK